MNVEKLRKARERLMLTQDYVAKYLGLSRSAIVQMENGKRKISADELAQLCSLYGISVDYALDRDKGMTSGEVFTRKFEALPDSDKEEILNLIEFKHQMALKKKASTKA